MHKRESGKGVEPGGGEAPQSILVVGAHPDDPETGCGGTIAHLSARGHSVTVLYLTRGGGWDLMLRELKTEKAVEDLRTRQSEEACKILGAKALFSPQKDGRTEITNERYQELHDLIEAQRPDVLLTHWPLDSHRDHRAASVLVFDFFLTCRRRLPLYFYEVYSGIQTQHFFPTDYVDITETEPAKKASVYVHEGQRIEDLYFMHEQMQRFRGHECGCPHAEAFIHHAHSPSSPLFQRRLP